MISSLLSLSSPFTALRLHSIKAFIARPGHRRRIVPSLTALHYRNASTSEPLPIRPTPRPSKFEVVSPFPPSGDQPAAISTLVEQLSGPDPTKFATLKGITGSGKSFVMSHVISELGRPALILCPTKTLAAQLCREVGGNEALRVELRRCLWLTTMRSTSTSMYDTPSANFDTTSNSHNKIFNTTRYARRSFVLSSLTLPWSSSCPTTTTTHRSPS